MRRTTPSVRNKAQFDAAGAIAAPLQCELQPARQPLGNCQNVLLARDRFGKTLLGDIRCDRQPRRQRLMFVAERTVELAQHFGAEARGERRARQIDDIADALQADAGKTCDRRRRKPQRGERQWRE